MSYIGSKWANQEQDKRIQQWLAAKDQADQARFTQLEADLQQLSQNQQMLLQAVKLDTFTQRQPTPTNANQQQPKALYQATPAFGMPWDVASVASEIAKQSAETGLISGLTQSSKAILRAAMQDDSTQFDRLSQTTPFQTMLTKLNVAVQPYINDPKTFNRYLQEAESALDPLINDPKRSLLDKAYAMHYASLIAALRGDEGVAHYHTQRASKHITADFMQDVGNAFDMDSANPLQAVKGFWNRVQRQMNNHSEEREELKHAVDRQSDVVPKLRRLREQLNSRPVIDVTPPEQQPKGFWAKLFGK